MKSRIFSEFLKKTTAFVLIAMLIIMSVQTSLIVMAAEDATKEYVEILGMSNSDNAVCDSASDPENIVITYGRDENQNPLKLYCNDSDKTFDVRIDISIPSDINVGYDKSAVYYDIFNDDTTLDEAQKNLIESHTQTMVLQLDINKVKNAVDKNQDYISLTRYFDWDNDKKVDQTVSIKVSLKDLVIFDSSNNEVLYKSVEFICKAVSNKKAVKGLNVNVAVKHHSSFPAGKTDKNGKSIFYVPYFSEDEEHSVECTMNGENYITLTQKKKINVSDNSIKWNFNIKEKNDTSISIDCEDTYVYKEGLQLKIGFTSDRIDDLSVKINEESFSLDDEGYITLDVHNIGDINIIANIPSNENYKATEISKTIKITQGNLDVLSFENSDYEIPYKNKRNDIKVNVSDSVSITGGDITYSSENSEIVSVDENTGEITANKLGSTIITASQSYGSNYKVATAQYNITVVKANQENVKFSESMDGLKVDCLQSFENPVVLNESDIKYRVVYESSDTNVATVDENGTVETLKAGEVTITATLSDLNENYNDATVSYTITVKEIEQNEMHFKQTTVDGSAIEIDFGSKFQNVVLGGSGNGAITYKSDDKEIATVDKNGNVKIIKAGEVTITATKAGDGTYKEQSVSYKLNINKANPQLKFDEPDNRSITYSNNSTYSNDATKVCSCSCDNIQYKSDNEDVATVDKDGKVTIHSAGTTNIIAYYSGCDHYCESSVSYELNVLPAYLTLSFGESNPTVTYTQNGSYKNILTIAESNIQGEDYNTSYKSSDTTVATVDENGNVTVNTAGTVTITVTVFGDDNKHYKDTDLSYTLTINKAEQDILFEKQDISVYYGTKETDVQKITYNGAYGTGDVTYKITKGDDIANIDSKTGKITFNDGKLGDVTVEATKAEDNNYIEKTISYNLHIEYYVIKEDVYDIYDDCEHKNEDNNGWYTGTISISAKEGYQLSYSPLFEEGWSDVLENVSENDVKNGKITIYVKNKDGYISDGYIIDINKDTVAPSAKIEIVETDNFWTSLCETLTFGYYDTEKEFKIYADDITSGIQRIEYMVYNNPEKLLTKDELDNIKGWIVYDHFDKSDDSEYKYSLSVNEKPNEKIVVYAKIIDNAGLCTYVSTNGVILDSIDPVPDIAVENGTIFGISDLVDNNIQLKASVTDSLPSSGIKSVSYTVNANGVSKTYDVDISREENEIIDSLTDLTLNIDTTVFNCDNISVTLNVVDNAGNDNNITKSINIDVTKPVVEVEFTDGLSAVNQKDGRSYYNSFRNADIIITERNSNFDADIATSGIKIFDAYNNPIELKSIEWKTNDNGGDNCTHIAKIELSDNNYNGISISYTDNAGNESVDGGYKSTDMFTVDTVKPEGKLTVNDNSWSELVEFLTFGIFTQKADISFDYSDNTSPILSAEYFTDVSNEIKSQSDLENISDWQDISNYSISDDDSYVVYFKIKDYANNTRYVSSNGFIVDNLPPKITTYYEKPNKNGFYNEDVIIDYTITDAEAGVKSVYYTIQCDGITTQEGSLYRFDVENPSYSDIEKTKEISSLTGDAEHITVDSKKNNSDNVVVTITFVDNVGNPDKTVIDLSISSTKPTIEVSYDNNSANKIVDGRGYFKTARKATVVITDRDSTFDSEAATNGVEITATDVNGNPITLPTNIISEWTTEKGDTPDSTKHTAVITYDTNANYTFNISYKNKADKENDGVIIDDVQVTPYKFTVDTEKPTGSVTVGSLGTWNELIENLTFGLWTKNSVDITADYNDVTSPIESVKYYKTDSVSKLTLSGLKALDDSKWSNYHKFSISSDERFTVYVRVEDYAGNVLYISTDGIVYDDEPSEITLDPDTPNKNGFYNSNVKIKYSVTEKEPRSGISSIKYVVKCDGVVTQQDELTFKSKNLPYDELCRTYSDEITVDSKKNNSDNVTVTLSTVDNAGNVNNKTINLKIDITKPVIQVKYDNNNVNQISNNRGYFNSSRKATIVITERMSGFDASAATHGIKIMATDVNGKTIELDKNMISSWKTTNGKTPDSTKHTATITYNADANYTFSISYTDNAGNKNNGVDTSDSVSPYQFTVDTLVPTGSVKVGNLGTWDKLISRLTFGLWTNSSVKISADYNDITSPLETVKYYKTSNTKALSVSALNNIPDSEWTAYKPFYVSSNENFTVYLKIEDYAGNIKYISSDGVIYDDKMPVFEKISPEITITQKIGYEIANTDVTLDISVIDSAVSDVYSGLNQIDYTVSNMGQITQQGELYRFNLDNPQYSQLKQRWDGNIVIDSKLNNSNDIKVVITAVDNAGNRSSKSYNLKIDTTSPDISVSYDNNRGTAINDTVYFNQSRTATVTITERNFDPDKVKVEIKNADGNVPLISSWKTNTGTGNGDNTTHTATITYSNDGNYTFAVSYTDMAGNKNTEVIYGASVSPNKFVIDHTAPKLNLNYNNNSSNNQIYYSSARTATITITEHNFNPENVDIVMTATDNGKTVAVPEISKWISNGDVHTATIDFVDDAHYTISINYKDFAGNSIDKFEKQSFLIDKTKPTVKVENIVENSANKDDVIGFVITSTDTNFDVFDVSIKRVDVNGNSENLNTGNFENINNGKKYTVNNIVSDGIYEMSLNIVDKAGNVCDTATLFKSDGEKYEKEYKDNTDLMLFSVNRTGSTFMLDNSFEKIVSDYYIKSVDDDMIITEINADEITHSSVYVNDVELKVNSDYSVKHTGGNGKWNQYVYTINKSLFQNEGEYAVKLKTTDKAENISYNDMKGVDIHFVVDDSSPTITISGLNIDGNNRYMEENHKITLVPKDDGGSLESVVVSVYNNNGNMIDGNGNITDSAIINLSGDKLTEALESNNGQLSFTLSSGIDMHVSIKCTDMAGNEPHIVDVYDITVSTSFLLIFYSNKPLFYGSIITAVIVITAVVILIVMIRRRRRRLPESK